MNIYTTEQLRAIRRATLESEGIASIELVHRFAEGVAAEILSRFSPSRPTVIYAGSGGNGAVALSVARIISEAGFQPHVLLFNFNGNSLSRDCNVAFHELMANELPFTLTEIRDRAELPALGPDMLIVDGLFGSGLKDPLSGGFMMLARNISESGATVISIDLPAGLFPDWNSRIIGRNVVHADLTIAPQFPHLSFMLADNAEMVGRWKTVDIGLVERGVDPAALKYFFVDREDVRNVLRERQPFSSKADYGSALLLAGSYGMMGAAVMSARACIRAGVGKLTVHSARWGFTVMQSQVPEALFEPDPNDILISDMTPRLTYNAIGVGPGIGMNDATRGAFETLVKSSNNLKRPMVIDADGINILARNPQLLDHLYPCTILTPHAGEFDRLFGAQSSAENRLLRALEMARKYKIIIVLKGHYTATVRPDGKVFFNSTGNAGMATGGSGDALTGIITALLAQGYKPEAAAVAGVFIHGTAGDIGAEIQGQYGLSGLDIAENVGKAIKQIMS